MTSEHDQQIRATVDKTVAQFIRDLPARLDKVLIKGVLSVIGFSQSDWDRKVQLDHCNGCKNLVADHIDIKVKEIVQDRINGVVLTYLDEIFDDRAKEAIRREVREVYRQKLRSAIELAVLARAHQDAEEMMVAVSVMDQAPLVVNTELEDPGSYPGATGEVLLEHIVKTEVVPAFGGVSV